MRTGPVRRDTRGGRVRRLLCWELQWAGQHVCLLPVLPRHILDERRGYVGHDVLALPALQRKQQRRQYKHLPWRQQRHPVPVPAWIYRACHGALRALRSQHL